MKTIIHEDPLAAGGIRVEVRVSRRNIETLLAKLDGHPPDSACTILGPVIWPATTLVAEENDVHYNDAERVEEVGDNRAGQMHPDTEALLAARATYADLLPDHTVVAADAGAVRLRGPAASEPEALRCGGNCNDYTGCDGTCGAFGGRR